MTENNRENLSEMEQIHRGLEEFLKKEVYEEYEARQARSMEEENREEPVSASGAGRNEERAPIQGRNQAGRQSQAAVVGRSAGKPESSAGGPAGRSAGKPEDSAGGPAGRSAGKPESSAGKAAGRGGKRNEKLRENSEEQKVKGKKQKKHKGVKRFLAVILILVLAAVILWYLTISHLYEKVEYEPTEILTDAPMKEEGVINILLIGNDSRVNGGDGRSDAMILVSISNRTKTIYMTSLLRDIYVEIPGYESNRLNAAYAFGGAELLLETIKLNFDIEVNRYVQVNFQAFANLIDAVGGVELELTNEEVKLVNAYLNEYNLLEGRPIDTDYLPSDAGGLLHLNGPQALAYSRNRYIGSDFGRTERQRKILEAVIRQLPSSVLTNLDDMIEGILPNLTTNISKTECYSLSLEVPKVLTYDIVQANIPLEGTYENVTIRKMAVLQVDFEKNKEYIRTQIYGEEAKQ